MAYQVIARKWRPQRFADMVGQEHIARTLKNAIITGRVAHAYLFVGPRGIGKTTAARIFAKALNCKRPVDGEPCCECSSCKSIADESNVDIIEIDAATHTQVDKAREICEEVLHLPISSKYKIYIIDEVHMLSKSAWNALLKTIEEPPPHAKFIFATTEVNKVLPTVISRCQKFDLRRIPSELIAQRLSLIAKTEKVNISQSAINVIAQAADGGMRDAQSLLDQLISFFGMGDSGEISEEQALSLFGLTAPAEMEALVTSILNDDRQTAVMSVHRFAEQGKNLETLFEEIISWFRGILLCRILKDPAPVLDASPEKIDLYKRVGGSVNPDAVQRLIEQLSASAYMLRESINKQVFIETILLKAMRTAHAVQIEDIIARLNQIRKTGGLEVLASVPPPQLGTGNPVKSQNVSEPPAEKKITESAPIQQFQPRQVIEQPEKKVVEKAPEPLKVVATPPPPQPEPEVSPVQKTAVEEKMKEPIPQKAPERPVAPVEEKAEQQDAAEYVEDESTDIPENEPEVSHPKNKISLAENYSAEKLWHLLCTDIRENIKAVGLGALMADAHPESISDDSILTACFDEEYGDVHCEKIMRDMNLINRRLKEITGCHEASVKIKQVKGLHSPHEESKKKSLDELKREVENTPIVQKTLDLFGGRIADVLG